VIRVPDYVEPVEGWRIWGVAERNGRLILRSLFFDTTWPYDFPLSACCEHRRFSLLTPWHRRATGHAAPEQTCACGIHAGFEPGSVMPYFQHRAAGTICGAVGRVALWGGVVQCTSGYRAQHAYPTHLYVPDVYRIRGRPWGRLDAGRVAEGLLRYGVPVETIGVQSEQEIVPRLIAA
jgi:hypothetical protein